MRKIYLDNESTSFPKAPGTGDAIKKYIEDQYIQNLKKYKYEGKDNSIYYKYIISPICDKITSYLPKWLVPNTITVMGWFLNFLSVILKENKVIFP